MSGLPAPLAAGVCAAARRASPALPVYARSITTSTDSLPHVFHVCHVRFMSCPPSLV
jgi:hypothetical protein